MPSPISLNVSVVRFRRKAYSAHTAPPKTTFVTALIINFTEAPRLVLYSPEQCGQGPSSHSISIRCVAPSPKNKPTYKLGRTSDCAVVCNMIEITRASSATPAASGPLDVWDRINHAIQDSTSNARAKSSGYLPEKWLMVKENPKPVFGTTSTLSEVS